MEHLQLHGATPCWKSGHKVLGTLHVEGLPEKLCANKIDYV